MLAQQSRMQSPKSDATDAQPAPKAPPSRSSLRRLEPEVESVLRDEPLPVANAAPETLWAEAPARAARARPALCAQMKCFPPSCSPGCILFEWRSARALRQLVVADGSGLATTGPRHCTPQRMNVFFLQRADGSWAYNDSDMRWHAVQPSSWPDDPPPGELDTAVIVQYAREHDYSDMEIISFIAHGYPGPELERCAVLGPPHVGTLKSPEAFLKSAKKDQEKGWVRHGYRLPPVWPMRADPMNIVFRNDKPRMTIDKTMQLVDGVDSYNSRIDSGISASDRLRFSQYAGSSCSHSHDCRSFSVDLGLRSRGLLPENGQTARARLDVWLRSW